ncbi:MAG: hypothetical protein ACKPCM_01360 [Pseudanabaena sp.]
MEFVLCIRNDDYPASIEKRKIYRVLSDPKATQQNFIRTIDESEEDYLYPIDYFVPIQIPQLAISAFATI